MYKRMIRVLKMLFRGGKYYLTGVQLNVIFYLAFKVAGSSNGRTSASGADYWRFESFPGSHKLFAVAQVYGVPI
jgi:hypothetical protein